MASNEYNYGFTRVNILERFSAYIEGPAEAFFLVVAETPLSAEARNAFDKSALALGWQQGPTYTWTNTSTPGEADENSRTGLHPDELFELVEGLDPICVVLVGQDTRELASAAYRQEVPSQGRFRLFGRDSCAFNNLDVLLQSESGKQTVWALLRGLPHAR